MGQDKERGAALVSFGPEPGPKPPRVRHDGFTPARKRKFFKTLRKTGCLSDSARVAGVSRETVRRHRNKWPDFATRMESALAFASGALEAIAWQRATVGAEEKIYRDRVRKQGLEEAADRTGVESGLGPPGPPGADSRE